jgi:hypothetical protein
MQQPHPGNEKRFAVVQPSGDDGKESVRDDPLGAGAPQRIGWFRFYFDDGRWEWSPQVEKMHGYLRAQSPRPPKWSWPTNIPTITARSLTHSI